MSSQVTIENLLTFQNNLFQQLDRRDKAITDAIEKQLEQITGTLNTTSQAHTDCREQVKPIIETYQAIRKWFWGLVGTNTISIIVIIMQIIRDGGIK